MTTTHDLPTVAGWWNGRDIDWRAKAGIRTNMGSKSAERQEREVEKQKLWSGLIEAGCASPGPPPDDAAPVVDGAAQFIGSTPCALAILPVEDMCALEEQAEIFPAQSMSIRTGAGGCRPAICLCNPESRSVSSVSAVRGGREWQYSHRHFRLALSRLVRQFLSARSAAEGRIGVRLIDFRHD